MKKILLFSMITCAVLYGHDDEYTNIQSNITVVGEGKIKQENTDNIKDMLDTETGIQVDEGKISIRGIGDEGRGIAVVDDGVSQTDVTGTFSFDIDTSELEKLVVYKGPGSIYSVNGTGGVVQAQTKSVFKMGDNIKAGYGSYGYEYLKANLKHYFNLDNVVNFTYTKKDSNNDYMEHSESRSDRFMFKYGHIIDDTSSIEMSAKYYDTQSDKIQTIDEERFDIFKSGGTIPNDYGMWVFNKDDKQTRTADIKYKKYFGEDLLKVSGFYKTLDKTQYQNGKIKISGDNYNAGFDMEYAFERENSSYLVGFTYKKDKTKDSNQYKYADINFTTKTKDGVTTETITDVFGTSIGDLISTGNTDNSLIGVYAQDEIRLSGKWKLDLSLRIDRVKINVDNTSYWKYNGDKYISQSGKLEKVSQESTLYTPRISFIYALNSSTNIYALIGHGEQTATDTQLLANLRNDMPTDLSAEKATNYEIGLKHASDTFLLSMSIYRTYTSNEIVEYKDPINSIKYYENVGKTRKTGLELGTKYTLNDFYYVGANYSAYKYTYKGYIAYDSVAGKNVDYSGNKIEGIPSYTYALYTGFKNPMKKIRAKVECITSGSYYTDRANTVSYEGYKFVTNIMAAWEPETNHMLMLNINNLFDERYAASVLTTSETVYSVAAPRTVIVSYQYKF